MAQVFLNSLKLTFVSMAEHTTHSIFVKTFHFFYNISISLVVFMNDYCCKMLHHSFKIISRHTSLCIVCGDRYIVLCLNVSSFSLLLVIVKA